MKTLRLMLRLRSPLCIARRPTAPGQLIETLPYITGTVVRGGLAAAWLQGKRYEKLDPSHQDTFRQLFLAPENHFGHCWMQDPVELNDATMIVPQTVYAEKHDNGWIADNGKGCQDQLVALLGQGKLADDSLDRLDHQFVCYDASNKRYRKLSIQKRLIARTAIAPKRETAQDRLLYTLETLETGQMFSGIIRGSEETLETLQATVLQPGQMLSFGMGRSRGLGEVRIDDVYDDDDSQSQYQSDTQRADDVETFKKMLAKKGWDTTRIALPVTLESDVLLRDTYLLPSSDANPATTLSRYLPMSEPLMHEMRLEPAGVVQSTHWISGWDEIRRLPRTPHLAITMGSVWTFSIPEEHRAAALAWWGHAHQHGIGERTNEGYGRVRLCHRMHMTQERL